MIEPLTFIRRRILWRIRPRGVLVFTVVVLLAAGAVLGLTALRGHVVSLPEFDVNVRSIAIADRPTWAPETLRAEIRKVMPEEANIFDRDLARKVHESCRNLYWVEEIHSVRKIYPSTLELRMKLRKPVAYVRHGGEPYLTDGRGRRLPRYYYRKVSSSPDLLYIKGIEGSPPDPGERWEDHEALLSAIATVEDICGKDVCRRAGITTVDVGNFNGRKDRIYSHVVLWTETQTRILWGRSSRTTEFGDLSTEEKLANLEKALRDYRDLSNVDYVNIYSVPNQCPGRYRSPGRRR